MITHSLEKDLIVAEAVISTKKTVSKMNPSIQEI